MPEMVDDEVHGLLVPPRDPQALARALERLISDRALHARLARQARERICERFDSRRTTVALRDLFVAQLRRAQDEAAVAREQDVADGVAP
jgi:glycosyltransferase involved in cell wall biosynthesis